MGGTPGTRRTDSDGAESAINLTKVGGEDITLGQKIGDESIPVTFASDQTLTITAEGEFVPASNKDEDTTHVTGDEGDFVLGVRQDNLPVGTSADADYGYFAIDSRGRQHVAPPHHAYGQLKQDNPAILSPIVKKSFDFVNGYLYKGFAAAGSSRAASVWTVIRTTLVNGLPDEDGTATGIAWNDISTATYLESVA